MYDAPSNVPVGQLLVGCVRGASITPSAYDESTLARAFEAPDFVSFLRAEAPDKVVQKERAEAASSLSCGERERERDRTAM